jgi:hypothetical protein
MLSDDESQALCEIERRLRWHSPELARLFDSHKPQLKAHHRQRATARALLAAAAIKGLVLLGPRMLTEAELRTKRRRPLPRTAPAESATAGRAGPVSGTAAPVGPVAVVDMFRLPPTIVATPFRYGTRAGERPACSVEQEPGHLKSLSRKK